MQNWLISQWLYGSIFKRQTDHTMHLVQIHPSRNALLSIINVPSYGNVWEFAGIWLHLVHNLNQSETSVSATTLLHAHLLSICTYCRWCHLATVPVTQSNTRMRWWVSLRQNYLHLLQHFWFDSKNFLVKIYFIGGWTNDRHEFSTYDWVRLSWWIAS